MSAFGIAFTNSTGRAANLAELGDRIMLTLVNPPASASNVSIVVQEMPGPSDAVTVPRTIATYSGSITGGKFKLDIPGGGDPLAVSPPDNPVLGNFPRTGSMKLDLQFADDPQTAPIPLPDKEDENGRFELQFQATATVAGKSVSFNPSAILNLSLWRDVMIVPDVTGLPDSTYNVELFRQAAQWGEQWRKFAGARRAVLKLPMNASIPDFVNVMTQAAGMAAHGDILLSVGHGAAGTGSSFAAFDSTPDTHPHFHEHDNVVSQVVLNLPQLATQDPQTGKWTANPGPATDRQKQVDLLSKVYDALVTVSKALTANHVKRFIPLTCRMGGDRVFRSDLSTLLKTTVAAYDQIFVSGGGGGKTSEIQVWLSPEHDEASIKASQPAMVDPPNDPSFHEIPGGLIGG